MSDASTETVETGTRKWPLLGVVLAVLWLFVAGVETHGLTAETGIAILGQFIFGLGVGLPIAYVTRRMYDENISVGASVAVLPAATKYVVLFLWELLTANVDVAYRVLSPSMPIDPDVIEVPLRVTSDAAITTIANSITLTPGTLTMDYNAETNTLYVHAITGRTDYDSVIDPIRAWEDLALVIFDEDASPDDPAPEPAGRTDGGIEGPGGGER